MGWHINLVLNTVEINSAIALDLYNCGADVCFCWEDECDFPQLGGIISDGKLVFNRDHMEHMDYVWQPEVQAVLKKHKVEGDICFMSSEGDNRGQYWGYRFFVDKDGVGQVVNLKGTWYACAFQGWKPVGKGAKTAPAEGVVRPLRPMKKSSKKSKPHPKDPMIEVRDRVEIEGFDYAFRHYSSFSEVKDKKFHALREKYVAAAEALEAYIEGR